MKKKTNEEYVKEVYEAVGEEYTVLGVYTGNKNNILIRHNICGHEWNPKPYSFPKNAKCPNCATNSKKTQIQFEKEVFSLFGNDISIIGIYEGALKPILIRHNSCGNEFEVIASDVLRQRFICYKCNPHPTMKTHEKYLEEVYNLVQDGYSILGIYIGNSIPILTRHNLCGNEYNVSPSNFLDNNRRCPECQKEISIKKRTLTPEEFKLKVEANSPNKYTLLESYIHSNIHILIRYNECGHEEYVNPSSILKGIGCKTCRDIRTGEIHGKTHQKFIEDVCMLVGDEYSVLEPYEKAVLPIKSRHNKCGKEFYKRPSAFLRGERCPICNNHPKGERKIIDHLELKNISYIPQYSFADCKNKRVLLFDFAIFMNNILVALIEYDGEQHFRPVDFFGGEKGFNERKFNDQIKNNYCLSSNIPLLRIPYWDFNSIEKILNDFIKELSLKSSSFLIIK